jgi:hypothetical protein
MSIAQTIENNFMTDNHVSPHLTLSAIEACVTKTFVSRV